MRIFKTKYFTKWAKKNLVNAALLHKAAIEISKGSFEANLGGFVLKKRIATKNRGITSQLTKKKPLKLLLVNY